MSHASAQKSHRKEQDHKTEKGTRSEVSLTGATEKSRRALPVILLI